MMDRALFIRAISRFLAGLLLVAGLLFIPAGTWDYPQGWLLIGILFVPMFIGGLVMMKKNPELLKKRLNVREQEAEQRSVILFSGIMFLAAFLSAGLSFRYNRLMLPVPVSIIAAGEYLSLQNCGSAGRPEGDRYRPLRDRPASDVYGDCAAVSGDAAGSGIRDFICYYALLHPDYSETDPE